MFFFQLYTFELYMNPQRSRQTQQQNSTRQNFVHAVKKMQQKINNTKPI